MQTLEPLPLKDKYFRNILKEIENIFDELIYKPLAITLAKFGQEFKNERSALAEAIRDGIVWYDDGQFKGSFNSRISKELRNLGATFNRRSKTFSLSPARIPPEISMAQADAQIRYSHLQHAVIKTLDSIDVNSISAISNIPDQYIQTIDAMETDFQKSLRAITIAPQLTAAQRGIIAAEWGFNLDLYIRKWAAENILKLRQDVQQNAFGGRRAGAMVKYIQENYGVGKRKAEFLARQETSLLMSKFRETRYRDIGSEEYIWRGAMDARERHDHKILEGKIFFWTSPPIVDQLTGRRANPGEDFGCRCVAVPVIK